MEVDDIVQRIRREQKETSDKRNIMSNLMTDDSFDHTKVHDIMYKYKAA